MRSQSFGPRRLYGEEYGTGTNRPQSYGDNGLRDRIATLALQAPTDPQTGADGTTAGENPITAPPASPAAMMGRAAASLPSFLTAAGQAADQALASSHPGPNQYTLGEVGNATIDRTPKTPFLQTGLGKAIRAGLGSLAMNLSPSAHGTAGFLGSLANGFTDATNLSDARTAAATQQQQAAQRQSFLDLLTKSQIGRNNAAAAASGAPSDAPRPLIVPGVGIEQPNADGTFTFQMDPVTHKRIIPPIAAVAGAEARASHPGQSPADKFYTQQYAKFQAMRDPTTGQPLYDNATAAGMAAQSAQTRFPGYHVIGYQPAHAQPNNPNASPAAVGVRLRNAGITDPTVISKAVGQRAQAQRPTVQWKIQITQDDWNRLRQDGMGAAHIQDQYAVPAGVGDQ